MASSVGKRQREQQKLEQAQAKAKRKAARREAAPESVVAPSQRSEADLIDDLGTLHRALEAGNVSPEEFELDRDRIQAQLEQLL